MTDEKRPSNKSKVRRLTPEELDELRRDMKESGEWIRQELKRRREVNAHIHSNPDTQDLAVDMTKTDHDGPVFLDDEGPSDVVPQGIYVTVRDE